jgi:uncharacterized integral membrane protein
VSRLSGPLAAAVALAFVLLFTRWNGAERVTLNLGFWTFYRVPMAWIAVGSVLLGMGIMLLAGLQSDLRVRRFLRERLARDEALAEEKARMDADRAQQDLFRPPDPSPLTSAPSTAVWTASEPDPTAPAETAPAEAERAETAPAQTQKPAVEAPSETHAFTRELWSGMSVSHPEDRHPEVPPSEGSPSEVSDPEARHPEAQRAEAADLAATHPETTDPDPPTTGTPPP